jgi:hypothetical protein
MDQIVTYSDAVVFGCPTFDAVSAEPVVKRMKEIYTLDRVIRTLTPHGNGKHQQAERWD